MHGSAGSIFDTEAYDTRRYIVAAWVSYDLIPTKIVDIEALAKTSISR